MSDIPPLSALGNRIIILGPSNAGKSTLAETLAATLGIPAIHLDQLYHLPNTNWNARSTAEFNTLQLAAVATESWVMDGNYSALMPERLARATGAVVLDGNRWLRLGRYFHRTWFQTYRSGALEGQKDSVKWAMIRWVAISSRHNGAHYRAMIEGTALPHVFCGSMREVKALYRHWGLERTR